MRNDWLLNIAAFIVAEIIFFAVGFLGGLILVMRVMPQAFMDDSPLPVLILGCFFGGIGLLVIPLCRKKDRAQGKLSQIRAQSRQGCPGYTKGKTS